MQWHIKTGRYWMVQWGKPIFFSLGIHIDYNLKYVDLHLIFIIITFGNPDWPYKEYKAWWSSRSI
jgi:hypothetical protein